MILFNSISLVIIILFINTIISFYYYIKLFLHIGNYQQYISVLSGVLEGGMLKRDYKSNLKKIEAYADEKTVFFLHRIILLTQLLGRFFVLVFILIVIWVFSELPNLI